MTCPICRHGTMQPGTTTVAVDEGGTAIVIRDVPAWICADCGEEYFDEDVVEALNRAADRLAGSGAQVAVMSYREAA